MTAAISYRAATAADLPQILALQQRNLPVAISDEEARQQGFVTVQHDLPLLSEMNTPYPHQVAVADDRVVGYTLMMQRAFAQRIPVLVPLFERIDGLHWQEQPLTSLDYFVMGQVAVDKAYRGQGLFDGLYRAMAERLLPPFQLIVTEIATRNTRSLRAHARVGFKVLQRFVAPDGEDWSIVAWDGQGRT